MIKEKPVFDILKVNFDNFKNSPVRKKVVIILAALTVPALLLFIPPVLQLLLSFISYIKQAHVAPFWSVQVLALARAWLVLLLLTAGFIIFFYSIAAAFIRHNRLLLTLIALVLGKELLIVMTVMGDDIARFPLFDLINIISYIKPLLWLAPLLAAFAFAYCFKRRRFFMLLIYALLSAVLFVYTLYYRSFNNFPTLEVLAGAGFNMKTVGVDGVFSTAKWRDIVLLLDIPLLFIILSLKKLNICEKRRFKKFAVMLGAALVIFLGNSTEPNRHYIMYARQYSPFSMNIYREINNMTNKRTLSEAEKEELKEFFLSNKDDNSSSSAGLLAGNNVIFILVESLESWVLNLRYEGVEIMPNLNRLLQHAYFFPNIYEQTASGGSSDGALLYNTGLYPIQGGSASILFPDNNYMALPKWFKRLGYSSFVVTPDQPIMWNRQRVMTSFGYDSTHHFGYRMAEPESADERSVFGFSDYGLFKQAIPMVLQQQQPFYILLITVDGHNPYLADAHYKYSEGISFSAATPGPLAGYLKGMYSTDYNIGLLIEALEKSGLAANTVLVFAGDHTGLSKYNAGRYPDPVGELGKERRVPLIIYHPSLDAKQIETIGGQIDLSPTLLSLMGITADDYKSAIMGKNLMAFYERGLPGYALLPSGEIKGQTDNTAFLAEASFWSDVIIRSDTSLAKED
jgi:lipoteichoic acid synthase